MIERIILYVLLGGSWYLNPCFLCASFRLELPPDFRLNGNGFRLVIVEKEG